MQEETEVLDSVWLCRIKEDLQGFCSNVLEGGRELVDPMVKTTESIPRGCPWQACGQGR
jgi:uncharacterized protein (DUF849 family)